MDATQPRLSACRRTVRVEIEDHGRSAASMCTGTSKEKKRCTEPAQLLRTRSILGNLDADFYMDFCEKSTTAAC